MQSSTQQPDLDALSAWTMLVLEQVPVGELVGAKLSRLLHSFLEHEVLPRARRAAGQGIDPTPLYAITADVLRLYADALNSADLTEYGRRPIPPAWWRDGRRDPGVLVPTR
jgi:hypothetical protein